MAQIRFEWSQINAISEIALVIVYRMEWSDIRTKVKSLKIDIAGRTRNSESLLLKITYLNIFVENHKE